MKHFCCYIYFLLLFFPICRHVLWSYFGYIDMLEYHITYSVCLLLNNLLAFALREKIRGYILVTKFTAIKKWNFFKMQGSVRASFDIINVTLSITNIVCYVIMEFYIFHLKTFEDVNSKVFLQWRWRNQQQMQQSKWNIEWRSLSLIGNLEIQKTQVAKKQDTDTKIPASRARSGT